MLLVSSRSSLLLLRQMRQRNLMCMLSLWALLLAKRQSLPVTRTQALVPCKLRLVLLTTQQAIPPQKMRLP